MGLFTTYYDIIDGYRWTITSDQQKVMKYGLNLSVFNLLYCYCFYGINGFFFGRDFVMLLPITCLMLNTEIVLGMYMQIGRKTGKVMSLRDFFGGQLIQQMQLTTWKHCMTALSQGSR